MVKNLENLFESNWDEVKGNIKSKWGKLTNQDIKQIEGSYDVLAGKIKKIYGLTRQEIEEDIDDFLSSEGIEEVKNKVKTVKDEVEDRITSIKDSLEESFKDYLEMLKEKSIALEKNIVSYAKDNPLKILGTAAVVCFAVTKMWSARK